MIRPIQVEEIPKLHKLAAKFYGASRFLKRFNLASFSECWRRLLETGAGVIFVDENEGEIAGTLGGVAYPEINSGELVATEFFWFVDPDRRGGGLRLYRAFERWARAKGCRELRMAYLMDSMPEKLDTLYRRLGFEPVEVQYVKELSL